MKNLLHLFVILSVSSDLWASSFRFETPKLVANYNFSSDLSNQISDNYHLVFEEYAGRCNFSNFQDSSVLCLSGRQLGFLSQIPVGTKDFPAVTFMAEIYGVHANGFLFSAKQPKKQLDEFVARGLLFENGKVYPGIVRNRVNFRLEGLKLKKDQWNIVGVSYNQIDSSIVYFTQDEYLVHKLVFNEPEAALVIGARYDDKNRCVAKVNELWVFHQAFTPQELGHIFGKTLTMAKSNDNKLDFNFKVLKILAAVYFLLAIFYMLFQLFFKRRWVLPIKSKQNQLIRKHSNLNTASANEKAELLLMQIKQCWTASLVDSNGEFKAVPANIDEIRTTIKLIDQIKYLAPVNESIINEITEISNVVNDRVGRVFNINYTILLAASLAPSLFFIYGIINSSIDWFHLVLLLLPAILYFFAAFTPRFLINKENKNIPWFGKFLNKLLVAFHIPVLSNDENTNRPTFVKFKSNSGSEVLFYWLKKILGFVIAIPISLLLAINNFIRNYLIYR